AMRCAGRWPAGPTRKAPRPRPNTSKKPSYNSPLFGKYRPSLVRQSLLLQGDRHGEGAFGARRKQGDTRLCREIPAKTLRIGDAMPGLDANKSGAGLGPDPEIGHARKFDLDPWPLVGAITQPAAGEMVEDDRVIREERV